MSSVRGCNVSREQCMKIFRVDNGGVRSGTFEGGSRSIVERVVVSEVAPVREAHGR